MSEQGMHPAGEGGQHAAGQAGQKPGAQLAAEREARGWTIEQVASRLNLAPRQVQAIESDNYVALPGIAVTRGFIRAYAKLLQVDAAPLLAALPGAGAVPEPVIPPGRTLSTPFSEHRLPLMSNRSRAPARRIVGAVLVVAILAAAWAVNEAGGIQALSAMLPAKTGQAPASDSAAPAQAEPVAAGSADAAPVIAADAPTVAETAPAAPTEPLTQPAPVASNAAPATEETGKDALVLKLREDSWIEIRRADKTVVTSRMTKAGTTETVPVTGPLSVTIGNARGVDASLRGEPIELGKNARNNVARLNVK